MGQSSLFVFAARSRIPLIPMRTDHRLFKREEQRLQPKERMLMLITSGKVITLFRFELRIDSGEYRIVRRILGCWTFYCVFVEKKTVVSSCFI